MKKISQYIFIVMVLFGILSPVLNIHAQEPGTQKCLYDTSTPPKIINSPCEQVPKYQLLQKLPDGKPAIDVKNSNALGDYLNIIIKVVIGLCAVLAVFMIFMGGIEYMTAEVISSKEEGKSRITHAIFGLLLALGAYTLLYTINPDLLNSNLDSLKDAVLTTQDEPEVGISGAPGTKIDLAGANITACDTTQMETINIFGHSVTVNKAVIPSLNRIQAKWAATGYKVNTIEGYVCREVAGKKGFLSAHAFGLAVDINAATNPMGPTLVTDMANYPTFTNSFISEGWGWGGNWASKKDAMHFSKYPTAEGGNGNLN